MTGNGFRREFRMRFARLLLLLSVTLAVLALPSVLMACVGEGCLQIWSTAAGGGALTMQWDSAKKVETFKSFCTTNDASCLYSNIDPGFIASPTAVPESGYFPLVDGTRVIVEIVSSAEGLTMNLNGQRLDQPGEQAVIGTMPELHNHPSWQILVPGGEFGDYEIRFRLKASPPSVYEDSAILMVTVTNERSAAPTGTPTSTAIPQPTATPLPCDGDCDTSQSVTVDEVLTCVNMALGTAGECPACDVDDDGAVTVNEIISAVSMALDGCPQAPVVTLAQVQESIFTPKCAVPLCHDSASANGDLILVDGLSEAQLVNVVPTVLLAAQAGQLRVDPGKPENSFLLIKLVGPPPGTGSPMPLVGDPLDAAEIQLVSDWILQGANP